MIAYSPLRSIRLLRKGFGVLHGSFDREMRLRFRPTARATRARRNGSREGSALVEVLISLSILGIAVVGVTSGSRASRLQAELASRRAAEALAAQQVLESKLIWGSEHSPVFDTVRIGVHDVAVRIDVRDSTPGLAWLRVRSDAGGGSVPWQVESARRIP